MSEDSEWRWIETNRSGRCKQCSAEIGKGALCLYSWKQRAIWCIPCAEKAGHQRPRQNKEGKEGTEGKAEYKEAVYRDATARCSGCQRMVSVSDFRTAYPSNQEPIQICDFCARLSVAQYWLKVAGLWTVPRRRLKQDNRDEIDMENAKKWLEEEDGKE